MCLSFENNLFSEQITWTTDMLSWIYFWHANTLCYNMTYILHNSVSQKIQKSLHNNRKDINVVQSLSTFLFNISNKELCKSSNLFCNNLLYHELRSKNQKPLKSGFLEMELGQNYNIWMLLQLRKSDWDCMLVSKLSNWGQLYVLSQIKNRTLKWV